MPWFDPDTVCPYMSDAKRKQKCIKRECSQWIQLHGTHPQTGAPTEEWGCARVLTALIALEGNKETRQLAGAVESFRNEVARGNVALSRQLNDLIEFDGPPNGQTVTLVGED